MGLSWSEWCQGKGTTWTRRENIGMVRVMMMTCIAEGMPSSDLTALSLFVFVPAPNNPSRPLGSILFAHPMGKLRQSSGRVCQGAGGLSHGWHWRSGSSLTVPILLSLPTETEMMQPHCLSLPDPSSLLTLNQRGQLHPQMLAFWRCFVGSGSLTGRRRTKVGPNSLLATGESTQEGASRDQA